MRIVDQKLTTNKSSPAEDSVEMLEKLVTKSMGTRLNLEAGGDRYLGDLKDTLH